MLWFKKSALIHWFVVWMLAMPGAAPGLELGARSWIQLSRMGGKNPITLEPSPLPPKVSTGRKPDSGAGHKPSGVGWGHCGLWVTRPPLAMTFTSLKWPLIRAGLAFPKCAAGLCGTGNPVGRGQLCRHYFCLKKISFLSKIEDFIKATKLLKNNNKKKN